MWSENLTTMRTIKFRAVFTNEVGVKITSINAFSLAQMASYEEHEWDFSDGTSLPSNDAEDGDLEYLEFSGLHDKNGKEIFEGDIIVNRKGAGERYPYRVVYREDWGKFVLNLIPWQVEGHKERTIYKSVQAAQNWEVMGNIYENSELL